MNNIDSTTRSSFFPNRDRAKGLSKAGNAFLKRNTPDRQEKLERLTKRDAKVTIPEAIKDFSRIKKAVDAVPPADNTEKIAKLKQQIQSGTYKVDYDALADKILSTEF